MNIEYKVETLSFTLPTKEKYRKHLQEVIDRYAEKGWKLHSFQIAGSAAELCVAVFYRGEE